MEHPAIQDEDVPIHPLDYLNSLPHKEMQAIAKNPLFTGGKSGYDYSKRLTALKNALQPHHGNWLTHAELYKILGDVREKS
jgi:hypothetical protein